MGVLKGEVGSGKWEVKVSVKKEVRSKIQTAVAGYWLLVTGYWLLVIGYWLLVIGYWLLVIGYWLLVKQPKERASSNKGIK